MARKLSGENISGKRSEISNGTQRGRGDEEKGINGEKCQPPSPLRQAQGYGGQGGMPGGGECGMPGGMDSGTKGNFINARFQNSEWTGTVIGVSKNASLNFDEKSSWKITAGTDIDTLTVAPGTTITADKPVRITVAKLVVSGGGSYRAGRNVTIETRKEETREDTK